MKKNKSYLVGTAHGVSMSPLIQNGDKLYFKRVPRKKLCIADIIVFLQHNYLISHRIIAFGKSDTILVKGDNNFSFDPPLTYSQILGKVILIKGTNGSIKLEKPLNRCIQFYYYFYSVTTSFIPKILYRLLRSVIRGRRILLTFIREKN